MSRTGVVLTWQAAPNFGWGILGLNLLRRWALSPRVQPLFAYPIGDVSFSSRAIAEVDALCAAVATSNRFAQALAGAAGPARVEGAVVHALCNGLERPFDIHGSRNIGRTVFEDTDIVDAARKLDGFDAFVCACRWTAEIIGSHTAKPVFVTHEAVDHGLFHPGRRTGLVRRDRFHVFTGGKIEFRKAQDLVLRAFRIFSERHDDAVLVTAWHSPWPELSEGFQGVLDAPLRRTESGQLDVVRWAGENGVDPSKIIDLGPVQNEFMPTILREMDCALQPSRAEGATNLVAMEAMSCGVPVVLAANTGARDLVADGNCIPLLRQGGVRRPEDRGAAGWGESDVEEIVDALERLYTSPDLRAGIGARGAAFMRGRTWDDHADALATIALSA